MPTVTSTLNAHLTNWGPLTTTFTPPPACVSSPDFVYMAPTSNPDLLGHSNGCSWDMGTCLPSPTDPDALRPLQSDWDLLQPNVIAYYSPGLLCPSGYTTVGTAARHGEDSAVEPQGIFATIERRSMMWFHLRSVLTLALDPSETAIACCPSNMTPDWVGGCTSILSAYTPTTACVRIMSPPVYMSTVITSHGETVTETILVPTGTDEVITSYVTYDPAVATDYVGVTTQLVVYMVHRAGDGEGGDSDTDSDTGDGGNGAAGLRSFGVVGSSVLVGLVAGVGMVLGRG
ncbi:hypothetical protein BJX63DRAFT_432505 [Aspergillus granulosus]|uniref:Uncharacterized protein n=1 Tax=Aspergillus granulosus TaxID=176169 RepID=A0ABR4HAW5_9EURO